MSYLPNDMAAHNFVLVLLVGLAPILICLVWMLTETVTITDLIYLFVSYSEENTLCSHLCEDGYFCLPGLENCHPVLDCIRINEDIVMREIIGKGAVKLVIIFLFQQFSQNINI